MLTAQGPHNHQYAAPPAHPKGHEAPLAERVTILSRQRLGVEQHGLRLFEGLAFVISGGLTAALVGSYTR